MDVVLQQAVNALSLGGIYALLALGLAVVFSIVGLINFAHGEVMTLAGYGVMFALGLSMPLPAVLLFGVVAAVVSALAMERIAFRSLRGADVTILLISSFAVSEMLKVLMQNGISARVKPVVLPDWMSATIELGPITVGMTPMLSIFTTALALLGLTLFLRKTVSGIAMRAAAGDFAMVRALGISANQVVATAFAVSGLLAGIAGVLWVSQRGSVDPLMGTVPVIKAFIAVVLGGLGSLPGAVLGGFLFGALEITLQASLPDNLLAFRDAFALTAVIAILLLRPNGLLPAQNGHRS